MFADMGQIIFYILYLTLYLYVVITTMYLLILALAGRFAKTIRFAPSPVKKKILVLVPAFKEDAIIIKTAEAAAAHNYPSEDFTVMVIADSLHNSTIQTLRTIPVKVIEVSFERSTKARSLNAAFNAVQHESFDIALILDADNVMEPGCLEQVNSAFHAHYKAVQCHRTAKNRNTSIAILDGISEEININLFRRGSSALGLSAMPLGSGMAFDFALLKNIFDAPAILDNPAEDREIEIELLKKSIRMIFLNGLYVYDEKVSEASVFQKQRTRWLEAQVNHVRRLFKQDIKSKSGTAEYYNILFQSLMLPRILYLLICGVLSLLLVLQYWFQVSLVYPLPVYWICWVLLYLFVLIISIPPRYYSVKTLRAMAYIPLLMVSMVKALFKIKKNRKEFLHTSKNYNSE